MKIAKSILIADPSKLRQKERGSRITVKRKRDYPKKPDWWIKLF
ncbi:MAG: hypothetical protein ACYS4W_10800 [Planctomycetota bacterium]|jgi:hypothetical protein